MPYKMDSLRSEFSVNMQKMLYTDKGVWGSPPSEQSVPTLSRLNQYLTYSPFSRGGGVRLHCFVIMDHRTNDQKLAISRAESFVLSELRKNILRTNGLEWPKDGAATLAPSGSSALWG